MINNKKEQLREKLADLEHEQWMSWSNYVANHNKLSKELIDKWVKNWKPYFELNEKTKNADRIWADKVLVLFEGWKKEFVRKLKEELRKKYWGRHTPIINGVINKLLEEEII